MGDGVAGDSCSAEVTAKGRCPRQIWLELSGEQAYPWHGKIGTAKGWHSQVETWVARKMQLPTGASNGLEL